MSIDIAHLHGESHDLVIKGRTEICKQRIAEKCKTWIAGEPIMNGSAMVINARPSLKQALCRLPE